MSGQLIQEQTKTNGIYVKKVRESWHKLVHVWFGGHRWDNEMSVYTVTKPQHKTDLNQSELIWRRNRSIQHVHHPSTLCSIILSTVSIWQHPGQAVRRCPQTHVPGLPTLESHYLKQKVIAYFVNNCYKISQTEWTVACNWPAMLSRSSDRTSFAWNIHKCPLLQEARQDWHANVTW